MRSASNNLLAGIFVIVGIIGFVLIILTLSGLRSWSSSNAAYTIRFSMDQGASGLRQGSTVRVGGQTAGTVQTVQYFTPPGTEVSTGVDVVISLNREIALYKDAIVQLELPLLGTVSTLNFPSVGSASAGRLEEGGIIPGTIAPPPFMTQIGYGDVQRSQVQQILSSGAKVASQSERLFADLSAQTEPLLKNVNDAATDLRAVSADLRQRLNTWGPRIDATLANAEKLSSDMQGTRQLVDDGLTRARDWIDNLQSMLRDNRPRIDNTIRNADELMARANTELMTSVQAALEDGRAGLRQFAEAGQRVNGLIAESSPEVRLILANARLSSDQLKLTLTEVRRNPWRLLYTPGRKELEQELLFDASRNYAAAVSDLRGISASLEAAAATSPADTTSAARLADLKNRLGESFQNYQQAEDRFLKLLLGEAK
jgi:ABC-type transporter Mla subunit MlaD